jgi:hypothetical protein
MRDCFYKHSAPGGAWATDIGITVLANCNTGVTQQTPADQSGNRIVELDNGKVRFCPGGHEYYRVCPRYETNS